VVVSKDTLEAFDAMS